MFVVWLSSEDMLSLKAVNQPRSTSLQPLLKMYIKNTYKNESGIAEQLVTLPTTLVFHSFHRFLIRQQIYPQCPWTNNQKKAHGLLA